MEKFSVLMSIYIKEKASYFEQCIDSVLSQTYMPDEIVIIKDGPLTNELNEVIDKYCNKNPNLFHIYQHEKNIGLGLSLREGVLKCKNELIARMDTDDICRKDRFEMQIQKFQNDSELKIVGSYISEFDGKADNVISIRKVPLKHEDIIKYQKRRSAFNHVTVMFKKSAVLEAGNYEHALYMEDDVLWSRMLIKNMKAMNISENLVNVRTGIDMIKRRGGWNYLKYYKDARKLIYNIGFISYYDYILTIFIQFIVCLIPKGLRVRIFTKLLRR